MTNRIKGFVVTLSEPMRDDDVEMIRTSIAMVKGVIDVSPVADQFGDGMNRAMIRMEMRNKILPAIEDALK